MEVLPVRGVQSIVAPRVQNVLPVAVEGQVHLKQKAQVQLKHWEAWYQVPETVDCVEDNIQVNTEVQYVLSVDVEGQVQLSIGTRCTACSGGESGWVSS